MRLIRILTLLLGLVVAAVGAGIALLSLATLKSSTDAWVAGFFLVVAAAGFGLVEFGAPGLLRGFLRAVGLTLRATLRWLFSLEALLHPVGLALAVVAIAPLAMAGGRSFAVGYALFGYIGWCLGSVVALAIRSRWWLRALLALVVSPILMFSLIGIAEAMWPKSIGEGALAFLGPLMFHWGGVGVSGVARLALTGVRAEPPPNA